MRDIDILDRYQDWDDSSPYSWSAEEYDGPDEDYDARLEMLAEEAIRNAERAE